MSPEEQKAILKRVLAELRYQKKVSTQGDMALKLGYGASYFSQLMNGAEPLNDKVLRQMERIFRLREDWILKGEGPVYIGEAPQQAPHPTLDLIAEIIKDKERLIAAAERAAEREREITDKMLASLERTDKRVERLEKANGQISTVLELLEQLVGDASTDVPKKKGAGKLQTGNQGT